MSKKLILSDSDAKVLIFVFSQQLNEIERGLKTNSDLRMQEELESYKCFFERMLRQLDAENEQTIS